MRPYFLFSFLVFATVMATACGKVNFQAEPAPANNSASGGGSGGGGEGGPAPSCTLTSSNTPILKSLPSGVTSADVAAICPPVGNDSECGAVIFISNSGVALYFTGQGPYDGNDDTLVGVMNMSSTVISALDLTSNLDIMGFDGDGLDGYTIIGTNRLVGGNSLDKSNYGGPNAYFTNITNGNTSGTVNFINAVSANGGTTFFALENALTSTTACLSTVPH